MFTFLLVVQAIIAASLVGVILMQRSEGGGLGMGGSPSGLMSARGAADFLTRATAVLATLFVVMSIALAALASVSRGSGRIDTSLARPEAQPMAPVGGANPLGAIPGPGLGGAPGVPGPAASLPVAPPPIVPQAAQPTSGGDLSPPLSSGAETSAPSGSGRHAKRPEAAAPADAGSAKAGATPTAGDGGKPGRVKAPSLDAVPLRQTPKVGTLAPAEPATISPPAPASSAPAPAPAVTSGASGGSTTSAPAGNNTGQ